MTEGVHSPRVIRFGIFEVDLQSGELRKSGLKLKLTGQPFKVLAILLERPGDVVTREELQKRLWPDTFVDIDHNLNTAINKIREVLGDSAENPRFVETLPRRGYRFIGEVAHENARPSVWENLKHRQHETHVSPSQTVEPPETFLSRSILRWPLLALTGLVLALVVYWLWPKPSQDKGSAASIAVLPFDDLSPSQDQKYLSEGLAEEILNDLVKVPDLRVAGRTSAFQMESKKKDLRTIGQMLNVSNILDGSVQKEGNRVRVTAKLIQTGDGFYRWSKSYDRDLKDVFAIEEDIAEDVTSALPGKVHPSKNPGKSQAATTINPEAFQDFLLARHLFWLHDANSSSKALEYANQSIQLEPAYAPAYALRADILLYAGGMAWLDYADAMKKFRPDVEKSIALAPELPDGYRVLSDIQAYVDSNCRAAEKTLNKARELAPADPENLGHAAILAICQGRQEEAVRLYKQELALDPFRPLEYCYLAQNLRYIGRYEEATANLKKALDLNPHDIWQIHETWGEVLLAQGRPQEAFAEMEKEPAGWSHELGMALAHHALGRREESDAVLARMISQYSNTMAYQIAQVYAYRGQLDEAFHWLDHAYETHDPGLVWFKTDLKMKCLRDDSRYAQLLRKLNLTD
jgi:TolB-like protein/DNA-binding winged helix-turn-helix (wHTH) protein/Flp pilus assembly protein TadD